MLLQHFFSRVAIATWTIAFLPAAETPNTGMADPAALISAFDHYRATLPADGARYLMMSLGTLRGITASGFNAGGSVQLDLNTNMVTSTVKGLPQNRPFELWLVQNRQADGSSTLADVRDVLVKVGSYQVHSGAHMLSAVLSAESFQESLPESVTNWFDTGAFSQPAPFSFGNEGLGIVRSGGWANSDISLLRSFSVTEHARLQIRGEFFNAFNHTILAPPGGTFGKSTFGVISVSAPPRQVQVGARLVF